jgi:type I restriction enzyme S subunit
MKTNAIPSSWLKLNELRLDSGPYLSGAAEAKVLLNELQVEKDLLGNISDVYHAGRLSRTYVDDPEYGVPFLKGGDILSADLSWLSLLSREQVKANPVLIIREGWILITRSGTIGRTAYVRSDMDSLSCSEDVMRVVPDTGKVPPGFLYAYLIGRFGVPLVLAGAYGSIIKHIEPHHLVNVPVPRLDDSLEQEAHNDIVEAARLRVEATRTIESVCGELEKQLGVWDEQIAASIRYLKTSTVAASAVHKSRRFEAYYHSEAAYSVEKRIQKLNSTEMHSVAKVVKPGMFRRIIVENPDHGIGFITGTNLFTIDPQPAYWVSPKTANIDDCILDSWWVLIQAFGQVGGLIGRCTMITPSLQGMSATDLQIQIRCGEPVDAGYIFAFLNTRAGYTLLTRLPIGGSIPHILPEDIESLVIPWPDTQMREAIGQKMLDAWMDRQRANELEKRARELVEKTIEEGR